MSFPFRCLPLDKPMPTMHVDHESLQKWQRPWGHDSFPCQNQNQAMSWYPISGRHHIIEDERQRMSLGDNPTFLLIIEPWSPTFGFDSLIVKSPCSAPHSTHLGLCESKVAPDLMADHYFPSFSLLLSWEAALGSRLQQVSEAVRGTHKWWGLFLGCRAGF